MLNLQKQEQLILNLQKPMNYEIFQKIWNIYQKCVNLKINLLHSILKGIKIQLEIRMNCIKTGDIVTNMDILSYKPNVSLMEIDSLQILQILDTNKKYENDVMIRVIQSIMDPLQYSFISTSIPADLCLNYFHNNSITPITNIQQKKFCGFILLELKTNEQITSKEKIINQLTNYITTNCGVCDNDFQKITESVKFLNYCLELIDNSRDFSNLITLIVEYVTYLRRSMPNDFTSSQQILVFDKYNIIEEQKQPCDVDMDVYPQLPCLMMERIYYLWQNNIECKCRHTSIVLAYSICAKYCHQKYEQNIWKDGFRGYYLSSQNTQEIHVKFSTAFNNIMIQHLHLFQEVGWWNKSSDLGPWDFLMNLLMNGSITMIEHMAQFLIQIEKGEFVTNGICDEDDSCLQGLFPKIIKGHCRHEIINQVKAQQMYRKQQNISIHRQSIKNIIEKINILAQLQCQMDRFDHCSHLFLEFIKRKINLSEFESNLTDMCCYFLLFRLIYEEKEYKELYTTTLGYLHLDMPKVNIENVLDDTNNYKKHNTFIKEAQKCHSVGEIKKHFETFVNDKSFGNNLNFNPVILIYIMDCICKNSIFMAANVGIIFNDKEQNWFSNFLPFHKHCTQSFKQKKSKKMINSKCKLNRNSTVIQDCIKSFQIKMRNLAGFVVPLLNSSGPSTEDALQKYWDEFKKEITENNFLKITTHTQQAHCVEQTFHVFNKQKNQLQITLKQKEFQNKNIVFYVSNELIEKSKYILQPCIQNNDIFKIMSVDLIDFIDKKKWNAIDLIKKSGNEEYAGLILLYPIVFKEENDKLVFAKMKFWEYEEWGQSLLSKLQVCTEKNYNMEISMRLQLPAEFSDNKEENIGFFIVIAEEKHRNNQLKCLLFQPHIHEMLSAPNVVSSLNALYLFYRHPNFFGWNKNAFAYNDYCIVDANKLIMRVLLVINIFKTHTQTDSWYVLYLCVFLSLFAFMFVCFYVCFVVCFHICVFLCFCENRLFLFSDDMIIDPTGTLITLFYTCLHSNFMIEPTIPEKCQNYNIFFFFLLCGCKIDNLINNPIPMQEFELLSTLMNTDLIMSSFTKCLSKYFAVKEIQNKRKEYVSKLNEILPVKSTKKGRTRIKTKQQTVKVVNNPFTKITKFGEKNPIDWSQLNVQGFIQNKRNVWEEIFNDFSGDVISMTPWILSALVCNLCKIILQRNFPPKIQIHKNTFENQKKSIVGKWVALYPTNVTHYTQLKNKKPKLLSWLNQYQSKIKRTAQNLNVRDKKTNVFVRVQGKNNIILVYFCLC